MLVMKTVTHARDRSAVAQVRRALSALDDELFQQTAASTSRLLDATLPRLTRAADHSVLWLGLAALLESTGNRRACSAARRGIAAIGVSSLLANQVGKRLAPRQRPPIALVPLLRRAHRVPTSSSFPSGHSASAVAFATAAGLELPELALPLAGLAAAVCYSRVYTGVHYPGDVLAGAALGGGVALALARIVPTHTPEAVRSPGSKRVTAPRSQTGHGVVALVNPRAGSGRGAAMVKVIERELPQAHVVVLDPGSDLVALLTEAARTASVLAVSGGDGTVSAAAGVAADTGLPLLVLPGGTFNHFAAALGLRSAADAFAALRSGEAVLVDLAEAAGRTFLNTASIGSYPEFVTVREKYEARLGKPLAAVVATVIVLRTAVVLPAVIDGRPTELAMLFIGNGRYQPHGFAPSWRPRLDDGLLDVRYVEAGHRLGLLRLSLALMAGRLGRSRVYHEDANVDLTIELPDGSTRLALDGEIAEGAADLHLTKRHRAVTVYSPVLGSLR